MSTLYASFVDATAAERAAGALLDHGAAAEDLSIVANEAYNSLRAVNANAKALDAEQGAKIGISTTTPGDVAAGAVKGATVGLGVGVAAALASVFIPGLGLILGGGALATALAGAGASIVGGAAAGSVVGYLKDQGLPDEMATRYSTAFTEGGAILAVAIPTADLPTGEVESLLVKYGAMNVATYNSAKVLIDDPAAMPPKVPLAIDNPNIDPIAVSSAPVAAVETIPAPGAGHTVIDAATGEARVVPTHVQPTMVDPITGVPAAAVAVDPLTGVERPVAVDPLTGAAVAPAVTPITSPVTGVTVDPVTGLPINPVPATPVVTEAVIEPASTTIIDPMPSTGVVVDPVTGMTRPATVAEGMAGEAIAPVADDTVVIEEDGATIIKKNADLY